MNPHAEALQDFEAELRGDIATLERQLAETVEDVNRYAEMLRRPGSEHAVALLTSHAERVGGLHRHLKIKCDMLRSLRTAVEHAERTAR